MEETIMGDVTAITKELDAMNKELAELRAFKANVDAQAATPDSTEQAKADLAALDSIFDQVGVPRQTQVKTGTPEQGEQGEQKELSRVERLQFVLGEYGQLQSRLAQISQNFDNALAEIRTAHAVLTGAGVKMKAPIVRDGKPTEEERDLSLVERVAELGYAAAQARNSAK